MKKNKLCEQSLYDRSEALAGATDHLYIDFVEMFSILYLDNASYYKTLDPWTH